MSWGKEITLSGEYAALEPLSLEHDGALQIAVADGELWQLWYTHIPQPQDMRAEITSRLDLREQGTMLPFAIRRQDTGAICGMTTYMHIDAANRRLEIGATWYAASVQRSAVNTECKLLLLTHAFETLDCIAVEFRTHWMNQQSRNAIARLGAKQDGILRNHAITKDGSYRDTVVFSIIASEWPMVKQHLRYKLGR